MRSTGSICYEDHSTSFFKMPAELLVPEPTRLRLAKYLYALQTGSVTPGAYLKRRLHDDSLKTLNADVLLDRLIATKIPRLYAESEVAGDGSDWNQIELGLLGDLSVAVPVTVFDDGRHTAPTVHPEPFQAELIFVPGALLRNGQGQTPADWAEVTTAVGQLNSEGFYQLYERRLLPVFQWIEQKSREKNARALVTLPGLGCGQFAGPFAGQLGYHLQEVLQRFLRTQGSSFPSVKAVYYDPFNECDNKRHSLHGIELLERPLLRGNQSRPQLCPPIAYEEAGDNFAHCHLYSIVAWDPVSWPGNDFYAGHRATDDGVKAAATSAMHVITGIEGRYDAERCAYIPPPDYENWESVVTRNELRSCLR